MKDESPALKKKINELTLVRVNVFELIYTVIMLPAYNTQLQSSVLLLVCASAGEPAVKAGAAEVSDQSRLPAE